MKSLKDNIKRILWTRPSDEVELDEIMSLISNHIEWLAESVEFLKASPESVGIAPADDAVGSEQRAFGRNSALDAAAKLIRSMNLLSSNRVSSV